MQLLLCCARTRIEPATAACVRQLAQQEIEWPYLHALARQHATLPLLLNALEAVCPERVPDSVLAALRKEYRASSWLSLVQLGELLDLLQLLQAAGICALPYKGPVMAAAVYGDVNLRQSGDLDILLSRADVTRAGALLQARSYRPNPGLPAALNSVQHAHAYHHPEKEIVIELHWGITRHYFPFSFPFERMWESRVEMSLAGRTVPFVPAELLLLILCVHGGKHAWSRLSWIADVAELLRREPALDWGQIERLAEETRSRRMLYLGLFLAHEWLGASMADAVWRKVAADRALPAMAAEVRHWLLARPDGMLGQLEVDMFCLRLREQTRDKISYFRHMAGKRMTPNEHETRALPLPFLLHFIHYTLRPLRLLRRYGVMPLKHVVRIFIR